MRHSKFNGKEIILSGKNKYLLEHWSYRESTWDEDNQKQVVLRWDEWKLYKRCFFKLLWSVVGSGRADPHDDYMREAYYFDTRDAAMEMINHIEES